MGINGQQFCEVTLDELEKCLPGAENYLVWKGIMKFQKAIEVTVSKILISCMRTIEFL